MSVQGWGMGVGGALVALLLVAAWVSWREGEVRAYRRLLILTGFLAIPVLVAGLGAGGFSHLLAWALLLGIGGGLLLVLLPLKGGGVVLGTPSPGVDEREIMFSRAALEPGTERFHQYYRAHPEHRTKDDLFRLEAGLLRPGTTHFHAAGFAAADAAFWTIETLRPFVSGGAGAGGGAGIGGGEDAGGGRGSMARKQGPGNDARDANQPSISLPKIQAMTRFLKEWALKCGAHSVGVTEVKDYHLYTHVGRGEGWGEEVGLDQPFALAFTVEMDKEMVDAAPQSPTVMESARQYLRSGVLAIHLADLIRRLGYRARAHVDGNYRVICPLVARDAGLGELGRMGLLMTPRLGPRVRIAVVTTDLPLVPDAPFHDASTLDFCLNCRKCAECCPSRALPFGDPEPDENGVRRWRVDAEACFTLWTRMGTDCARCMAVCPYSHPDNLLHQLVRHGIRHNALFRRGARWMDDLVYGRRPPPKPLPPWLQRVEATGARAGRDSGR